ncbi:MAG: hypothetical protein ACE5GC_03465 [Acidimicrobiia bacterium]
MTSSRLMFAAAAATAAVLVAAACGGSDTADTGGGAIVPLDRDAYVAALLNSDGSFWRRVDAVNLGIAEADVDPSSFVVGGTMGAELTRYFDALAGFAPPDELAAAHASYLSAMDDMASALAIVATVGGDAPFPSLIATHPALIAQLESATARLGAACADLATPLGLSLDAAGIRCENWD